MCQKTQPAEISLPSAVTAPRAARAFARSAGCTDHATEVLDEALLLISELVTNAVEHGLAPILVAIECDDGGGLRVRVRDGNPQLPRPRQASEAEESGRGLTLLQRLSHAWGVEPVDDGHGVGKAVWFELRPSD